MEYISHEDYKSMMDSFKKGTPKKILKEGLEQEGNAFTAGLAKAKKGQEFKVGAKSVKDTSNYDAPIKEEGEGQAKVLGHVKGTTYKVRTPKGEVIDLDFDVEKGDKIDDYVYEGSLEAEDDEYYYVLPVALVVAGGGSYSVEPYYEEFSAEPIKRGVKEYQFDQMYPEDPGPFEGEVEESHEGNDQWYDTFSDELAQLQISDKARQLVDRALKHADVTSTYGDMKPQEAAKEFVRDIVAMFKKQVKESGTGDEPVDFNKSAIESASGDKISHTETDDYGRAIYWGTKNPNVTYYIGDDDQIIKYDGETGERYPIGDLRHYDEPTHDYEPDTDADYEEPRDDFDMAGDFNDGEFWENEVKKMQEIAGLREDIEWDDEDEEKKEKRAKKAEEADEEAENAEREIDEDTAVSSTPMKDIFIRLIGPDQGPREYADWNRGGLNRVSDNVVRVLRQDPEFQELEKKANELRDHRALAALIAKEYGPELKGKEGMDRQNTAINYAGQEMLAAGMPRVTVSNLLSGYGYFEDWISDYISDLYDMLGRDKTEEGLHMPPLQATGQTIVTNEDQAPYGFSVLSPDERKQLKEYINSYKTIKKEISSLLEKAGKSGNIMEGIVEDEAVPAERPAHYNEPTKTPKHKSSNLGGNRTGLVMTKAEMWENEEVEDTAHDKIEGQLDHKLHDAFHKVTGMIMKDLMADGFDEGDIKLFLQHEIEEKAKEATMSQHDF